MSTSPTIQDLHFEILGVTRTSTKDEIKKAYRSQQKLWHPDRNPDKIAEATERSKKINDAYDILRDYNPKKIDISTGTKPPPKREPPYQPKWDARPKGERLNVEHTRVNSSNIRSIGYESSMRVMQIEFMNGSIYQYYEVPAFIYFEIMQAPSKGKYLNRIIFGRYRYDGF